MKYAIVTVLILALLSGCSMRHMHLPYKSPEAYCDAHPEWDQYVRADILDGKIWVGMSRDMLLASWGAPDRVNRSAGTWGSRYQYVYRRGNYHAQYVYLSKGKVVSFQSY